MDAVNPIDAFGDRWKTDFESKEDRAPEPVIEQPVVQEAIPSSSHEKNVMHRWQRLLIEAQALVRDCEDRTSELNQKFVDHILAKYHKKLIDDNSAKMWIVFSTAIAGAACGVWSSTMRDGRGRKWMAVLGERGFSQASQMANTYYDSNRAVHERTKASYEYMIRAAERVADGHRSVMQELTNVQSRIDTEKSKAAAAG